MSIKEDFLDEIQEGDYVELIYGQQGSLIVAGWVLKITSNIVRLQCSDRSPRIALDSIISYDTPNPQTEGQEAESSTETARVVHPAAPLADVEVQRFLDICMNSRRPSDEIIANWDNLCEDIRENRDDKDAYSRISGILDSFQNLKHQLPQLSAVDMGNRLHDLRAKVLRLISSCPEYGQTLYCMLGSMYYQLRDFESSAQYYAMGEDFEGAYYAAASCREPKLREKCRDYLEQYVRMDRHAGAYILLQYACQAAREQDVSALRERLDVLNERQPQLDEDDQEDLQTLISCAAVIVNAAGLSQKWLIDTIGQGELLRLEAFFDALPETWTVKQASVREAALPAPAQSEASAQNVSKIVYFDEVEKLCGFIQEQERDCFFHLSQVKPDSLLRALLAQRKAIGLEVAYYHGMNFDGQRAATNITLTENGMNEAQRRLSTPHISPAGHIINLDRSSNTYWISLAGKGYALKWEDIPDPYLRIYLKTHPDQFDVAIEADLSRQPNNDKIEPINARFSDEAPELSPSDVQEGLRISAATQAELDNWPALKLQCMREALLITSNKEEYFKEMRFVELPPWCSQTESAVGNKPGRAAAPIRLDRASALPALEPLPRDHDSMFLNLEPFQSDREEGQLYALARDCAMAGNPEQAEEYYILSIRAGEDIDLAVPGLVDLYLRDEDRVMDALDLMEAYGNYMSDEEKRRNQMISIYQRAKGRPFKIRLCHFLENSLDKVSRISTQMHYLSIQGNTLRLLGCYALALNSYKRWRHLYNNEVRYQGPSAAEELSDSLNTVRRGEAICYYCLNNKEKARDLANDLLRFNSSDTTAVEILNDTFPMSDEKNTAGSEDGYLYEETDADFHAGAAEICQFITDRLSALEISQFITKRLSALDITKYVQDIENPNVDKGQYIGSPAEAEEDIRQYVKLAEETNAQEVRSDLLLCAAWIVLAMFSRAKAQPSLFEQLKRKCLTEGLAECYIGRSMTAYGDFMLGRAVQMDTSRYMYLQTMRLMNPIARDWINSLNRYVSSYFFRQSEMWMMVTRENSEQENNGKKERVHGWGDLFIRNSDTASNNGDAFDDEFVVGLLQLLRVLRHINVKLWHKLLNQLYQSPLAGRVSIWLVRSGVEAHADFIDSIGSIDNFKESLGKAEDCLTAAEQRLKETLKAAPKQILSTEANRHIVEQLSSQDYRQWLNKTEDYRLKSLRAVLERLSGYHTSPRFEDRISLLDESLRDIGRLRNEIAEYPTKLSNDLFLPVLENIRTNLAAESTRLYEQQSPELEIAQTIHAYIDSNRHIRVHLSIQNGSGRQRADNIELTTGPIGGGITFAGMFPSVLSSIDGGSEQEVILMFRSGARTAAPNSFNLSAAFTYCYKSSASDLETGVAEFNGIIVVNAGGNEKIDNVFSSHIGNPMEDDKMFYGRAPVIEQLLAMLQRPDGQLNHGHGAVLYGQTRAGKSSIGYHFTKQLRGKEGSNFILVNMGNLEDIPINESSFYSRFLNILQDELRANHPELLRVLEEENIPNPSGRILDEPEHALFLFTNYLRQLDTQIRGPRARFNKMIVVVIDEFSCIHTAINKGDLPDSFMRAWKAMLENYGLFAVVLGQDDTPQFVHDHQNAFESMHVSKVSYLEAEPAKQLIWQPIAIKNHTGSSGNRFTGSALDDLHALICGSAFLTMKLCSALVEYLNEIGACFVTPAIIENFLNKKVFCSHSCIEEADFEPQIGDRSDPSRAKENKSLLLAIARASQKTGWAEINSLECPDISEESRQPLLDRLAERDVIEKKENRLCRIEVTLLAKWLLVQYGKE